MGTPLSTSATSILVQRLIQSLSHLRQIQYKPCKSTFANHQTEWFQSHYLSALFFLSHLIVLISVLWNFTLRCHFHRPGLATIHLTTLIDWVVVLRPTWHKIGHFGDVPQDNLVAWYGKTKPNTTKHTFAIKKKCTTTQNKHKKLRHLAWKRRGPILVLALHKFITY